MPYRLLLPVVAVVVLILDYITKAWAINTLKPIPWTERSLPGRIEIIPGFFDFLWAENTGGAFSLFHDKPWLITLFATIATLMILTWSFRLPRRSVQAQLAFGLILGGAIGNLIDRVRFQYVVDFIHFYFIKDGKEYFWPTFNVADMGIVAGIIWFLYLSLFTKQLDPIEKDKMQPTGAPEAPAETVGGQ